MYLHIDIIIEPNSQSEESKQEERRQNSLNVLNELIAALENIPDK